MSSLQGERQAINKVNFKISYTENKILWVRGKLPIPHVLVCSHCFSVPEINFSYCSIVARTYNIVRLSGK